MSFSNKGDLLSIIFSPSNILIICLCMCGAIELTYSYAETGQKYNFISSVKFDEHKNKHEAFFLVYFFFP